MWIYQVSVVAPHLVMQVIWAGQKRLAWLHFCDNLAINLTFDRIATR